MGKFFIRTQNSNGDTYLYTRIRRRTPPINTAVCTEIVVDLKKWMESGEDIDTYVYLFDGESQAKRSKAEKVRQRANALSLKIGELCNDKSLGFDEIKQQALEAIWPNKKDERERIEKARRETEERQRQMEEEERQQREEEAARKRMAKEKEDADVILYLSRLIEGMKNGSLLIEGKGRNRGERYTPNTIKMWNNLLGILRRYHNERPFSWNDIDKRFATNFQNWMEAEGYMAKSVNKYVGQFIALINRAYADGKHTNVGAAASFIKKAVDEEKKATEIYLTADELNALYKMKLTGEEAIVRDIFIVGCCTCQRVSDYGNLRRENFTTTARGTKVVKLRQTKTKNNVVIPILDDKLIKIAEKYDYQIPSVPDQVLNRYIKAICARLSVRVRSLAVELPTILTMKERAKEERGEVTYKRDEQGRVVKPRYDLITSHTARRTGITNLYLTGKFDVVQMMAVSGHKEAKTFKEYIKLSDEEIADKIAEKMEDDNLF